MKANSASASSSCCRHPSLYNFCFSSSAPKNYAVSSTMYFVWLLINSVHALYTKWASSLKIFERLRARLFWNPLSIILDPPLHAYNAVCFLTPFCPVPCIVLFLALFCLYAILSLHSCLLSCPCFRFKFSLLWITKCHDIIWNSVFYCLCSHFQYSIIILHTASILTVPWKIPKSYKEMCYTFFVLHVTTKRVDRACCGLLFRFQFILCSFVSYIWFPHKIAPK